MAYVSPVDLGRIVNALHAEENPLVKASLLRNYVDMLDASNGTLKNADQHYGRAYTEYLHVISHLNKDDRELIKVFKKRADYCKDKSIPPARKD
jgi:hypothetical protein